MAAPRKSAGPADLISVVLHRERETKATHVFVAPEQTNGRPPIDKVYITKDSLVTLGYPHTVRVTVERGAAEE